MAEQLIIDFNKRLPSPVHGDELLPEEQRIIDLIKAGRENAIQARTIAAITGLRNVTVRAIIAHLITAHRIAIVSATTPPAGYFRPINEAEANAGARQLVNRIRALAFRLKRLDRAVYSQLFQISFLESLTNEQDIGK